VPQADGGAVQASIFLAGGDQTPARGGNYAEDGFDDAAARLASSRGMQKAQQVQLQLNDEAVTALLQLETAHASELLEIVADKHTSLRDPSNYIVATIARGFVPKANANDPPPPPGLPPGLPRTPPPRQPLPHPPQPPPWGPHVVPPHSSAPPVYTNGSMGKSAGPRGPNDLVPPDLSQVEAKVLELNAQDLWSGQQINVETLVAMRCVRQDQALQLLGSLEAKGRGKGGISVRDPNNYVQAAVVKIGKSAAEGGSGGFSSRSEAVVVPPPGWNAAGNKKVVGPPRRSNYEDIYEDVMAVGWQKPRDEVPWRAPGGQQDAAAAKRTRRS